MDAAPLAHLVRQYEAAKALSGLPNVTLLHYDEMKRDLPGCFARVAARLDVNYTPEQMETLVAAARFEHMRANAERFAPSGGKGFFKSDAAFFNSGTSGKWAGRLSAAQLAAYEEAMPRMLPPAERAWLETGSTGA